MMGEWIGQGARAVCGVQAGHVAFQLRPGANRQFSQDLVKHVACMTHVIEGATAARALRVARIERAASLRCQELVIPPQRAFSDTGVDVVVAGMPLRPMYRKAGAGRDPADPIRGQLLPDTRATSFGA